jgi:hypothetical protein
MLCGGGKRDLYDLALTWDVFPWTLDREARVDRVGMATVFHRG